MWVSLCVFVYLNSWFPVCGALWEGLGVTLLDEVSGWEHGDFKVQPFLVFPFWFMLVVEAVTALLPVTVVTLLPHCPHHCAPKLPGTINENNLVLSESCFGHGVSSQKQKNNEYKNLSLSFLPFFSFTFPASSWFQLCLAMWIVYFSLVLFILCFVSLLA